MLPLGRPPTVSLTVDSPTHLTASSAGLTPRHTLSVHDCDGANREWVVDSTVAKVSIFNSQNLTLRLNGRILTSTVEVFKCRDVRIVVGPKNSPAATDSEAAEPPQPLGTLQLDPPLDNVAIEYASPTHVGKIVIAPLPSEDALGRATFGFSQLSFRSASEAEPTVLFDERGALQFPGQSGERPVVISPGVGGFDMARQLVVSCGQDGRWQVTGLERGEKDYPVMA